GGRGVSATPGCRGACGSPRCACPRQSPADSGVRASGTDGGGGAQYCRLSVCNFTDLCQREALQGAPQNLFRSIQSQQSNQRQWRPEMDPQGRWWLLERMQQTSERVTPRVDV